MCAFQTSILVTLQINQPTKAFSLKMGIKQIGILI